MSERQQLVIRLVALCLVAVIVQTVVVSEIPVLGVIADLMPLVVMSVGLLSGSINGAVFGFAAGFLNDTVLLQTLGVSSLIYVAIGYAAGRFREIYDLNNGLLPVIAGGLTAISATLGLTVIQFLLGTDAPLSALLLRQIAATVLLGSLLSLPVYLVVHRVLASCMPKQLRRRRQRAYTTGGLSPITQIDD